MKKRDAVKHYKTASALADALGIRPQAIHQWGDMVPKKRAIVLQRITRGKLKYAPSDYA